MTKMNLFSLSGCLVIAAIGVTTHGALAAKDQHAGSGSFTVGLSVTKGCSVTSPGDFDFGVQNQTPWLRKTVMRPLTVTCTVGTDYDLTFRGLNDGDAGGMQRYMTSTSSDSRILYYIRKINFFIPAGEDYSLGNETAPAANRYSATGTGVSQSINLYLVIDQNGWLGTAAHPVPPPKSGYYSDTVAAQVSF